MNKKHITLVSLLTFLGLSYSKAALAICPVCTVAVTAGVGLAQYLKIDDTITGLWIGALTISTVLWTVHWLRRHMDIDFTGIKAVIGALFYFLIFYPLYITDIIGNPLNTIFGLDRLAFGIVIGSIMFLVGEKISNIIIKKNGGKVNFRYQRVVVPMSGLIILSIIFYYLTKG